MRFPKPLRAAAPVAMLAGLVLLAAGSAAAQGTGTTLPPNYAYSAGYDAVLRAGQTALPAQDVLERVFFDFDSAELRPDGRTTLQTLADQMGEGDVAQVNVIGHTDTAGPAEYNLALSRRRAETVSQALTSLGVDNQIIDVAWEGETAPLVETGDDTPEQQNRRVDVTIPAATGFRAASVP